MIRPGARIGVFAPSHRFDALRLEAGLQVLRDAGHQPVLAPNVFATHRYLAGTDAERLSDLEWALNDPELDAAWMVRGGSGLGRLLPMLSRPRRGAIGFSDGTALHVALFQRHGLQGWHAPVLHSLTSQGLKRPVSTWDGEGSGRAAGRVVGGNLCVLTSLCGTPDQLQAQGCLLALEDIGEPAYKVDRMLNQLRLSGALQGVVGVLLGDFGELPELLDIVREHLDLPFAFGLPFGHGALNLPWRYGQPAELVEGRLTWR